MTPMIEAMTLCEHANVLHPRRDAGELRREVVTAAGPSNSERTQSVFPESRAAPRKQGQSLKLVGNLQEPGPGVFSHHHAN